MQHNSQDCSNKHQALRQLHHLFFSSKSSPVKLGDLKFLTKAQEKFYKAMEKKTIIFSKGPAGTGKTHLSVHFALKQLADKESPVDGIVICKPLICVDNEKFGWLKGGMKEKTDPFMNPYWQKFEKIIGKQITDILETTGIINIVVPAFLRGMEFENKVVLYDESQNSSCTAMKTFLTRLGRDSKMIITGDPKQSDKDDISGLEDAMARLSKIKDITTANFTREDIVRHGLIREILDCYED